MYLDLNDTYFENEHPILEMNTVVSSHLENEHSQKVDYEQRSFSLAIWVPTYLPTWVQSIMPLRFPMTNINVQTISERITIVLIPMYVQGQFVLYKISIHCPKLRTVT